MSFKCCLTLNQEHCWHTTQPSNLEVSCVVGVKELMDELNMLLDTKPGTLLAYDTTFKLTGIVCCIYVTIAQKTKPSISEYLLELFSDSDVDDDDMISYEQ